MTALQSRRARERQASMLRMVSKAGKRAVGRSPKLRPTGQRHGRAAGQRGTLRRRAHPDAAGASSAAPKAAPAVGEREQRADVQKRSPKLVSLLRKALYAVLHRYQTIPMQSQAHQSSMYPFLALLSGLDVGVFFFSQENNETKRRKREDVGRRER